MDKEKRILRSVRKAADEVCASSVWCICVSLRGKQKV